MSETTIISFDLLLQQVVLQAKAAGVPVSDAIYPHVIVNSRAKSRFGRCIRRGSQYTIELSSILLQAPEFSCRQTLAHELIHTCAGCDNHGPLFRHYAAIMNDQYGYHISRTNALEEMGLPSDAANRKVNYLLQCLQCGRQFPRTRHSAVVAHPNRYACPCGGKLTRIK